MILLPLLPFACAHDDEAGDGGGRRRVQPDPPALQIAALAEPGRGVLPLSVTLSLDANRDDLASVTWTLPDGAAVEGARAATTLLAAGDATVLVHVVTDDGEEADAMVTVAAEAPTCPIAGASAVTGVVQTTALDEVSGLVASRRSPGVFWSHNDNPDPARLFAFDAGGRHLGEFDLDATVDDLEDLATAPHPTSGRMRLYLADIGDNDLERDTIAVLIVAEPAVTVGQDPVERDLDEPLTVQMHYPDGPHNAETLLVDPVTDDLFVVTKSPTGAASVYRKAAPHRDGEEVELELVLALDFSRPPLSGGPTTGGDISPYGDRIVIRTYGQVAWMWLRDGSETVAEALAGPPCAVPIAQEQQGESVAFAVDGAGLWTVPEGVSPEIHFVPLLPGD